MVDGVLFATAGARRNVVAINGATGETLWMWRYDEGARAQRSPASFGPWRRLLDRRKGRADSLHHARLSPDRARREVRAGRPRASASMASSISGRISDQPTPKEGQIGSSSPPMIVGDVAIVGAAMQAGGAPNKENIAGHVRGYDVRTGKRVWIFHTVPKPGEFGHDTWLDHSASYTGNTAVWAPMSADLELGTCICRWRHRPGTSTAAIGPGTTCSPTASCVSMPGPASASGISSSSTTTSGIPTRRRLQRWSTSPSMAVR